jgi:hypothetical protein
MSPQVNYLLNQTVNIYSSLDKEQHYKFLLVSFPKLKFLPRLNYIKKVQSTKEDNDNINKIAISKEISTREARALLELTKQIP